MKMRKHDWMQAWVSLIHASTRLRGGLEAEFRDALGVSLAEQDLMKQLDANDGRLTLSELGKRIYFSKAGITRMLDRLEADDLVRRQPIPGERRAMSAALTRKGRATLKRSREILSAYVKREFADQLPPHELLALKAALETLLRAHGEWDGQQRHLRGAAHHDDAHHNRAHHDDAHRDEASARRRKRAARAKKTA